ncbi:MAG: DMT family transporter [Spirochaetaceae bacterium]|nr:DMT family transporter [Spirochaetaceae bacterium]
MNNNKKNYYQGLLATVISSFFFGMIGIFSTIGQTAGLTLTMRLFFRFAISAIIMLFVIKIQKKSLKLNKGVFLKLSIGAIFFFSFTSYLLFLSYDYIGTGLTTVLDFTFPLMVLILAIVIDKEKVSKLQIVGTVLAFIGLIFAIGPSLQVNAIGIFFALFSAVTFTFYIRMLAKDYAKNLDNFVLLFYMFLISTVFWGIPATYTYFTTDVKIEMSGALLSIIGMSIICTVLACSFFNLGVKKIGGRMTSILSAFEPVTAVFIGSVILGERLTDSFRVGLSLIILGTILVSIFEDKKAKRVTIMVLDETPIKVTRVSTIQRFIHRA